MYHDTIMWYQYHNTMVPVKVTTPLLRYHSAQKCKYRFAFLCEHQNGRYISGQSSCGTEYDEAVDYGTDPAATTTTVVHVACGCA